MRTKRKCEECGVPLNKFNRMFLGLSCFKAVCKECGKKYKERGFPVTYDYLEFPDELNPWRKTG